MSTFIKHKNNVHCHICGDLTNQQIDIWYPDNPNTDITPTNYIRICYKCIEQTYTLLHSNNNSDSVSSKELEHEPILTFYDN